MLGLNFEDFRTQGMKHLSEYQLRMLSFKNQLKLYQTSQFPGNSAPKIVFPNFAWAFETQQTLSRWAPPLTLHRLIIIFRSGHGT